MHVPDGFLDLPTSVGTGAVAVVGVGLAAYPAGEAARIRGRRSDEIEALLGYRGAAVLIHRDDMVLDDR